MHSSLCLKLLVLYVGAHAPQPAPQDPEKSPKSAPAAAPLAAHQVQPPLSADSSKPSQPPADDPTLELSSSSPSPKGQLDKAEGQATSHPQQDQGRRRNLEEDVGGSRRMLREHVVHVTEAAAGLQGLESNEAECKKVTRLQLPFQLVMLYW